MSENRLNKSPFLLDSFNEPAIQGLWSTYSFFFHFLYLLASFFFIFFKLFHTAVWAFFKGFASFLRSVFTVLMQVLKSIWREVFRKADLVILDRSLLQINKDEIKDIAVEMTVINGEVLYESKAHGKSRTFWFRLFFVKVQELQLDLQLILVV